MALTTTLIAIGTPPKVASVRSDGHCVRTYERLGRATVISALLLGACSAGAENGQTATPATGLAFNDEQDAAATTTTTLIAEAPAVTLAEGDLGYVQFEATWVCELQRRTFPTPDAIELALNEKLQELGLEREAYDTFRSRVNNDQDLRDSILFAYQETCRP